MIFGLNLVELCVGFCIQLPFYYILGLWVVPLGLVSGVLWAVGGSTWGGKAFRRIGVPLLTGATLSVATHSWVALLGIIPGIIACSLGYGEKSWLWVYFYKVSGGKHNVADYSTRMLTYAFYWLGFGIPLFFS